MDLDEIEAEEQRLLKARKQNMNNAYNNNLEYKQKYSELIKSDYPPKVSVNTSRQTVLCTKSDKLVGVKEDERYEVITLHPFTIRSLTSGSVISEADPTTFILA